MNQPKNIHFFSHFHSLLRLTSVINVQYTRIPIPPSLALYITSHAYEFYIFAFVSIVGVLCPFSLYYPLDMVFFLSILIYACLRKWLTAPFWLLMYIAFFHMLRLQLVLLLVIVAFVKYRWYWFDGN